MSHHVSISSCGLGKATIDFTLKVAILSKHSSSSAISPYFQYSLTLENKSFQIIFRLFSNLFSTNEHLEIRLLLLFPLVVYLLVTVTGLERGETCPRHPPTFSGACGDDSLAPRREKASDFLFALISSLV